MGRVSPAVERGRWSKDSDEGKAGVSVSGKPEKTGENNSRAIITETFQERDGVIHGNFGFQFSNESNGEVKVDMIGKRMDTEYVGTEAAGTENQISEFKAIPGLQKRMEQGETEDSLFNMGWGKSGKEKKNKKVSDSSSGGLSICSGVDVDSDDLPLILGECCHFSCPGVAVTIFISSKK
nr:hypothetical protein CFP56_31198 [Quercus suber]